MPPCTSSAAGVLNAKGDPRTVAVDPDAGYFGIPIEETSIVPVGEARIGEKTLDQWLQESTNS